MDKFNGKQIKYHLIDILDPTIDYSVFQFKNDFHAIYQNLSENNILNNEINYSYEKDDLYFNISGSAHEDLSKSNHTRYEYFLPNISYGQSLVSSQSFGTLDFRTQAYQTNFNAKTTNKFFIIDFFV